MTRHPDDFYDEFFSFGIRKPPSWRFVPAAWSPATLMRNSADPASIWRQRARHPFVCLMASHGSQIEAYPTVQVIARPSAVPTSAEADAILEQQIEFMAQQFPDFDALEWSSSNIVNGYRASILRSWYTIVAGEDDEIILSVLARSVVVFTPGVAFTIGMTSSEDPRFCTESEFETILSSVTIGKRG